MGEDVGFVRDGDGGGFVALFGLRAKLLPPQCDFSGFLRDAGGGAGGDAFDGFGDLAAVVGRVGVGLLLFDVEVLGVFTYDDQVDGLWGGGFERGRGHGSARADVGVQV